jgi:hypothetical protein
MFYFIIASSFSAEFEKEFSPLLENDTFTICKESDLVEKMLNKQKTSQADSTLPTIYFVTPTYPRR